MFFELLKTFLKNIMPLHEEEYNFKSHKFNPLKVTTVGILIGSLVFNVIVVIRMGALHDKVEKACPGVLHKK